MESENLYLTFCKTRLDIPWVPKTNKNLKIKRKVRRNFLPLFLFVASGGQGSLYKGTRDLFASRIKVRFHSSQACFGGKVLAGKSELLRQLNFGSILPGEYACVYGVSC